MKITYAGPTGDPVRYIDDGASAVRRAVKTTLRNLKRWCVRLRRGTNRVGFKGNRQNCSGEIKVLGERTRPTMTIDQEESRNRDNENLENELRESLAYNGGQQSERTVSSATTPHVRPDVATDDADEPVARTDTTAT